VAVYVLEKNEKFGQETSSRQSGVIHSGIYYPFGSMKAKLCVEGNRLLYELCGKHGIGHKRLGKLIAEGTPGEITRQTNTTSLEEAFLALSRQEAEA
jgi:L-2-hydroxyglutarate oxidase LhgO